MDCPRCGLAAVAEPVCPRCGVVFAKLQAARPRPRPAAALEDSPAEREKGPAGGWVGTVGGLLAIVVGGFIAIRAFQKPSAKPATASSGARQETAVPAAPAGASAEVPAPQFSELAIPRAEEIKVDTAQASADDRARAENLSRRLLSPFSLGKADLDQAEDLLRRYPGEKPLRDLLEAVLLGVASGAEKQRRFAEAAAHLRRAAEVQPASVRPPLALVQVSLATGDWAAAEAAARAAIAIDPRNHDSWQALGFALFRQDRNREAADALRSALDIRDDSQTRGLLDRIQKGLSDERGMAERQVSHFHVRYDGQEHDDVGREIVRGLERHYATLTSTLDFQPTAAIAVILFSRESYYNATGAPAWAGGHHDEFDGRIRIPIGGLTTNLTPEMDGTLIHELTHAFVSQRTRGVAPREIHEGLAQYNEGKRLESLLPPEYVEALADGRLRGVGGYYMAALGYIEYLIALRGMGGMNDLLKAMGDTGDVDEAFRQVHGTTMRGSIQAWSQRFQRQHGR